MKSFSERPMWAGFALFFSMYYVLESNPTILRDIGIPASAALLGTFLAVILGNLSGAFLTNTGLMIAPAIGISVFVKNFVLNAGTIDWRHAMLACAIGGILVFLTSLFTDWRARIVNELPDPVKKGATAGIGALLVKEGFDIFEAATTKFHFEPRWGGIFVGLGVIILASFAAARARFESASNDEQQSGKMSFFRFAMHLEFVLVVVVMSFYLWTFQPSYINELQENAKLTFLWADPEVWQRSWNFDDTGVKATIVFFAVTVWFIVISDIPGTPSVVLPDHWKAADGATATKDEAAKKGYVNDGIFAFLSPVFGTTPTIYYAENQILKSFGKQGEYSRATGLWATALFAAVFAAVLAGQIWPAFQIPIQKLLSPIAITPILIFIGLYIIAVPFVETPEKKTEGAAEPKPHIGPEYYFPAAISVILTSRIGLEFALPISVLSFWLVRPKGDPMPGLSFRWISVGSVFTLIFFVSTFANPKTKIDLYPCKPCSECTCPTKTSPLKG